MDSRLIEVFQDLTKFAQTFFKIIPKRGGEATPFIFNSAQQYIHKRLEDQRKATGKVRAVILKGRQQGCCFSEQMKVLTSDYRWVKIADVKVGDKLVSCDEESPGITRIGRKQSRQFRTALVEAKKEFTKMTYEVIFDNGARLEVTDDHRMLCKRRGGDDQLWRHVEDFKIGDLVRVVMRPPNYECQTYEDGWMAGIIDGEGSCRLKTKRLSVHQVKGKVLDRMRAYFVNNNIPYKEVIDSRCSGINKLGRKPVHRLDVHRLPYLMEIFARCRPTRFTQEEWHLGHELPGKAAQDGIKPWASIISIKPLKKQKVIDLQTSTKTYICEGLVSHNSTYIQGRFFHRVITTNGVKAYILTHEADATNNLFEMTRRYYELLPEGLSYVADKSNAKKLYFSELGSGYAIGTAGNKGTGRSQTIQLFHGCLAEGTPIYNPINGGLINIEELLVGNEVLTHTGLIAPISVISTQEKECLSVTLRSLGSFPLIATPEHRFWTKEGWKELSELQETDSIGYPVSKIENTLDSLSIPVAPKRAHGGGAQGKYPDEIKVTYELGRMVGLYLAEGHLKLSNREPPEPSNINFTIHRKETERTVKWLEYFKSYYSSMSIQHRKDCLTTTINIYGNRFARLILNLCDRTIKKHVPLNWRSLGEDFCRGMLHGYIAGDGHSDTKERRIRASSICSAITIPMRDIAASLGYGWASVEYKEKGVRFGRNEKARYTFSLCGNGASRLAEEIGKPTIVPKNIKTNSTKNFAAQITEISDGYAWLRIRKIESSGLKKVYDLEVNHEDHSYCILHGATHNSETAYWPNADEHSAGVMEAVANEPNTEIILESTANGIGNFFHQMWGAASGGESEYQAIFVPWFWQTEYRANLPGFRLNEDEEELFEYYKDKGMTIEHLAWRRQKLNNKKLDPEQALAKFQQEYPCSPEEAFHNPIDNIFINSKCVLAARKASVDTDSSLIVGVDPAIGDNDRTAIIRRRGRLAYKLQVVRNHNTMEVAGLIVKIIQEERPSKIYIDCIGIGAGIVDRLNEMGYYFVEGVNVARTANDRERFGNLRAELWSEMRDWLMSEMPVQIPDDDNLHSDLCSLGFKHKSNGQLLIESKDKLRARGMPSCDTADALMLTFYAGQHAMQMAQVDTIPLHVQSMFY